MLYFHMFRTYENDLNYPPTTLQLSDFFIANMQRYQRRFVYGEELYLVETTELFSRDGNVVTVKHYENKIVGINLYL